MLETTLVALLTADDLAALLKCSKATIWRRVDDGSLPQPLRIGGISRWRASAVEEALDASCGQAARRQHGS